MNKTNNYSQNSLPTIVQWGMWVWISTASLAWAVAREWWIWTISSAWLANLPEYKEIYKQLLSSKWDKSSQDIYEETNCYAIQNEIKKAKEISNWNWQIYINIMCAVNWFEKQVLAACQAGVDGIVCWAWFPFTLPWMTQDYPHIKIIPIISNLRWAKIIIEKRKKNYNRLPDAIVLEDPFNAWWHLGISKISELEDDKSDKKLENSIPQTKQYIQENWYNIPIIAAWWIKNHQDIQKIKNLWADSTQLGTRFLLSEESNANDDTKNKIIQAIAQDIIVYPSSAWIPARALSYSEIFKKTDETKDNCPIKCLTHCGLIEKNKNLYQMCILDALTQCTKWNTKWFNKRLIFVGTCAADINKILSVKDIMKELKWENQNI